jgi:hypothetical protein
MGSERRPGLWTNWRSSVSLTSFINEVLFGILFGSALSLVILLVDAADLITLLLAVAGCLLLFWLLRLLAVQIWQLLLPSFVLLAAPFFLTMIAWGPRLIFTAAVLILAVRAVGKRIGEAPPADRIPGAGNTIAALAWLLAVNLFAAWQNLDGLVTVTFYLGCAYLLLTVFRRHHIALTSRLARFVTMTSQPTGRIKRFNRFLLLGFVALLVAILLAAPFLHLEQIIPWLASLLLLGVKKLFQFLLTLFPNGNGSETVPSETTEPPEPTETGGLPDGGEAPPWLVVVQEILIYLLMIGTAVILLIVVVSVLYSLYRRFYENRRSGPDILESLLPKFSSQIQENVRRGQIRWERLFGRSPEQKIRRNYYRLVEELIRRGLALDAGETPRGIAELARAQIEESAAGAAILAEMTDLYEKARYGPGICTTDDARRMLELNRQFHQKRERTEHG